MPDRDTPLVAASAADQTTLRRTNLALVLRSLRDGGARSRARLAADPGCPRPPSPASSPSSPSAGWSVRATSRAAASADRA